MRFTCHGISRQRGEALSLKDGVQATACSASAKFDLDQTKPGPRGTLAVNASSMASHGDVRC